MMTTGSAPARADRQARLWYVRMAPDILVLFGFALLTVALTYPIVWHLSDSLPGRPVDNFHYLWELWYPAHAIFDLHTLGLVLD